MKAEDIRKVDSRFSQDLEALALLQNKRFWKFIDQAIDSSKVEGYVDLADLDVPTCRTDSINA